MEKIMQQSTESKQRTRPFQRATFTLLMLGCSAWTFGQNPNATTNFITIWEADPDGQVIIPILDDASLTYNFDVYWEKVSNTAINGSQTGVTAGTQNTLSYFNSTVYGYLISGLTIGEKYRVEISGTFPQIKVLSMMGQRLLEISQWGSAINWTSFEHAFRQAQEMDVTASDVPNLSGVTSLNGMFQMCYELKGTNANWAWNTSTITNMTYLFHSCQFFEGNIGSWDVSNVKNMDWMFFGTQSFNHSLDAWDVSNVETASYMFNAAWYNKSLGAWKLSSLTANGGTNMFYSSRMDCVNWSATLIGWAANVSDQSSNTTIGTGYNTGSAELAMFYSLDAADAIATLVAHGFKFSTGLNIHTPAGANPTTTSAGTISGAKEFCAGNTSTYTTSGDSGGTWSIFGGGLDSEGDVMQSISQDGVLNSVFNDFDHVISIMYSVGEPTCPSKAYKYVHLTVNTLDYKRLPLCMKEGTSSSSITLSDNPSGATWTFNGNSNLTGYDLNEETAVLTVNDTITTAIALSYNYKNTDANGCVTTQFIEVQTVLPHTMGTISFPNDKDTVCVGDNFTATYDGASSLDGNTAVWVSQPWVSNNTDIATVDPTIGAVTTLLGGVVEISYAIRGDMGLAIGTCFDTVRTKTLVVLPATAGLIIGDNEVNVGMTTALTSTAGTGGTWSSSDEAKATVDPNTGVVTGVADGNVVIKYSVNNDCGTDETTHNMEVKLCVPLPNPGIIDGTDSLAVDASTTLTSNGDGGGTWTSDKPNVVNVHATTGVATAVNVGTATITYTVTNACGTLSATKNITVQVPSEGGGDPPSNGVEDLASVSNVSLYPNPTNYDVNIEFTVQNTADITVQLMDLNGKIMETVAINNATIGTNTLKLNVYDYASGVYSVVIRSDNSLTTKRLVVQN